MTTSSSSLVLAFAVLAGCAAPDLAPGQSPETPSSSPAEATSPAVPDADPSSAEQAESAPIVTQFRGPAVVTAPSDIDVELGISRFGSATLPLDVTLRVPPGASLLRGLAHEVVTDASPTIARKFRLHVVSVPSGDLGAVVEMKGADFGARAQAFYRFGRPEPKLPEAPRGRPIVLPGGRNLGAPIPIR